MEKRDEEEEDEMSDDELLRAVNAIESYSGDMSDEELVRFIDADPILSTHFRSRNDTQVR
jgi:hypothetical protein